jgi:hypothetical protein
MRLETPQNNLRNSFNYTMMIRNFVRELPLDLLTVIAINALLGVAR